MKQLALLLCLALAGCGFHPLYGSHGSTGGSGKDGHQLSQIHIDTIADRQGQKLRNDLIDIMQPKGEEPNPQYHLTVTYNEVEVDLGLTNDAVTTRGQLTLTVIYKLSSLKDGSVVSNGSAQAITAYNIQTSEFATILSRDDAEDRGLRQLADNISLRLNLYFEKAAENKANGARTPMAAPTTNASGSGAGTSGH